MRVRISLFVTALPSLLAISLSAQHVVIKGATPSDVIKAVSNELSSQDFTLYDSTRSEAIFSLDRGVTTLNIRGSVSTITQVLELHLRFKQKSDGLEVNANEEMVGARGQHMRIPESGALQRRAGQHAEAPGPHQIGSRSSARVALSQCVLLCDRRTRDMAHAEFRCAFRKVE